MKDHTQNDCDNCTITGEHALSKGRIVFCDLHAAAEDMREALRELVRVQVLMPQGNVTLALLVEQARAALAKAEGKA